MANRSWDTASIMSVGVPTDHSEWRRRSPSGRLAGTAGDMSKVRVPEHAAEETEDLRSRTDARRELQAREESLLRHAARLVELPPSVLAKLDLPEGVIEAVAECRAIRAASARNRALRLVRTALRELDLEALERSLARVHRPPRPPRGS
jgi:ribosomal 50S subunit-associated protein YjgA (DUF615 family)